MHELLDNLNPSQREAVGNYKGPCMVIAGAGSGKTRVLTYRIAYLLSQGVSAGSVLALTFTNKAAREMKERIAGLVGFDTAKYLWMGTFHSMFAKILRYEAKNLGYTSQFTIYDTVDSKSIIKNIIKEKNLDEKMYPVNEVLSRISRCKNNLITPQSYASNAGQMEFDRKSRRPEMAVIFSTYATRCFKSGAMDFDDLLLNTNILFRDHPDILEKYSTKFNYILVDEYQDTNFSQYLIIKKLSAANQNICIVGDDAQSIYSFRGARIENILNFKKDYPDCKTYKLEQNYRSTQTIVNAANSVISKNKKQLSKQVWSDNEVGDKIKVIRTNTDIEEARMITDSILDTKYRFRCFHRDFCVLYRTNAQSRALEESMRKNNIPYKVYGGISFYQRKEIKDLVAYLRMVINPNDREAFRRIINYPARGIGNTTIEKMEEFIDATDTPLWNLLSDPDQFDIGLNNGTNNRIKTFSGLIQTFSSLLPTMDAFDLTYTVAKDTGILHDLYNDKTPEGVSRYENIQELLNGIKEFTVSPEFETPMQATLDKFLENIALLTNEDKDKSEEKDNVSLMTIHSAKGLEFENVYIAGVEEDIFPNRMSSETAEELEEERRLFYVALTRAKKRATILYALSRYRWGSVTSSNPSRFIREIEKKYVDAPSDQDSFSCDSSEDKDFDFMREKYFEKKQPKERPKQIQKPPHHFVSLRSEKSPAPEDAVFSTSPTGTEVQVGMQVQHERFGIGKVINIEGAPPNERATVFFQSSGQRQLLLKFAKLKIIT